MEIQKLNCRFIILRRF